MACVARLNCGVTCLVQGAIFLLAAVPLALGALGLLRQKWFHDHAAFRRGMYYFIVFVLFAADGVYRTNVHRTQIEAQEQTLAPVITSIEQYHATHGAYPMTLEELQGTATPPHMRVSYALDADGGYRLMFVHDAIVQHRYVPGTHQWVDNI